MLSFHYFNFGQRQSYVRIHGQEIFIYTSVLLCSKSPNPIEEVLHIYQVGQGLGPEGLALLRGLLVLREDGEDARLLNMLMDHR